MFLIVEFTDKNEVAVIPSSWLVGDGNSAHWPPYRSSMRLASAVKSREIPNSQWSVFPVRKLYETGEILLHYLNEN